MDDKSNKAVRSTHKSKENKRKGSGESHVELDSRLLSALLMVSIVCVEVTVHDLKKICNFNQLP